MGLFDTLKAVLSGGDTTAPRAEPAPRLDTEAMLQEAVVAEEAERAEAAAYSEYAQPAIDHSSPLLQPVEGFTLQQYGEIVGRQMAGEDVDAIVAEYGLDRARYDRLSAVWNERMAEDTEFVVARVYSDALTAASTRARGTGDEPALSHEQYLDAMYAVEAGTKAGRDPQAVIAAQGINFADYVNAGAYWSKQVQHWLEQEGPDSPRLAEFHELHEHYSAKHAVARQDQDLVF